MNGEYWGKLGRWATLLAGVAFCLYWAFTGTLSPALMLLFMVLGGVAACVASSLESAADSVRSIGMNMLLIASLFELLIPLRSPNPAIFGTTGAAALSLALICYWLAARQGTISKSYGFGQRPVTWGDWAAALFLLALLSGALFITVSYSTPWGWDIWRAIRAVGQFVLLLLFGHGMLIRPALPARSGSPDTP